MHKLVNRKKAMNPSLASFFSLHIVLVAGVISLTPVAGALGSDSPHNSAVERCDRLGIERLSSQFYDCFASSICADKRFPPAQELGTDSCIRGVRAGKVATYVERPMPGLKPEVASSVKQPPGTVTPSAPRLALVIGNDSYKSVPKLIAAREDARTVATSLAALGYKVTLELDLSEKQMKAALRTFAAQVQGGDEVVFFFAGHGVQLGAANYLLPVDIAGESEIQVRDEAIQLQRVLDDMSERKAKFTLAIVDACRDNPFKTSGRTIGGRGLAPTSAATGQMIIFSAGTGQQALDRLGSSDKHKNGLFTRVFIEQMQRPGVSIDRVMKDVRAQVAERAKTIGHEQVPAIYDQVIGDFYFKR